MIRNILDYQGNVVGQMELPDDTPEEVWESKLAPYKVAPKDPREVALQYMIKERKEFAEGMLERLKARNILAGVNIVKALWLHHRMRAWEVKLPAQYGGFSYTLDILNMAISGDLETAYFALRFGTIDDMTQPQHCVDADMIGFLKNELSNYLGFNLG